LIPAILYVVVGLLLAVAGARFMYTSRYKYGDLSFFRAWTPRSLSFYGGAVLLCLGLWLLVTVVRKWG
jgi:prolipoprotein diacylglyceryltransferase